MDIGIYSINGARYMVGEDPVWVTAQETKIKWFGHAAFAVTTPQGKVLLLDPWLNNPLNPAAKAKGTVSPSLMPMTKSRTMAED